MPTIGVTTLYPASYGWGVNCMYVSRFTAPEAGYMTKIGLGLASPGGTQTCRGVVYDASGNLLAQSGDILVAGTPTLAWYQMPLPNIPFNAGQIYVGVWMDGSNQPVFAMDSAVGGVFQVSFGVGATVPTTLPAPGATMNWSQSAYVEYTLTPGKTATTLSFGCNPTHGIVPWVSQINGSLLNNLGVGIPNAQIVIETSADGGLTWTSTGATAVTGATGIFSTTIEFLAANGWIAGISQPLRAVFVGDATYEASASASVVVTMDATPQYTLTVNSQPSGVTFTIT